MISEDIFCSIIPRPDYTWYFDLSDPSKIWQYMKKQKDKKINAKIKKEYAKKNDLEDSEDDEKYKLSPIEQGLLVMWKFLKDFIQSSE